MSLDRYGVSRLRGKCSSQLWQAEQRETSKDGPGHLSLYPPWQVSAGTCRHSTLKLGLQWEDIGRGLRLATQRQPRGARVWPGPQLWGKQDRVWVCHRNPVINARSAPPFTATFSGCSRPAQLHFYEPWESTRAIGCPHVKAGLKSESVPSGAPLGTGSDNDWTHTMTVEVGLKFEPRLSGFGGFLQLAALWAQPCRISKQITGLGGSDVAARWCGPAHAELGLRSGSTPWLPGQFQVLNSLQLCWVPGLGFSKFVPVDLHCWICEHSAWATSEMTASIHKAETVQCPQQCTSWDHTTGDRWLQSALPRGQLLGINTQCLLSSPSRSTPVLTTSHHSSEIYLQTSIPTTGKQILHLRGLWQPQSKEEALINMQSRLCSQHKSHHNQGDNSHYTKNMRLTQATQRCSHIKTALWDHSR